MSITCYNLSDDWGWYIDIESLQPIYQIKTEFIKTKNKKLNYHLNRLETIEEDEYDYYIKNNKLILDELNEIDELKKNKKNLEIFEYFDYKSTTLIGVLTFVIFFVL
jgi:hypothetical protein